MKNLLNVLRADSIALFFIQERPVELHICSAKAWRWTIAGKHKINVESISGLFHLPCKFDAIRLGTPGIYHASSNFFKNNHKELPSVNSLC